MHRVGERRPLGSLVGIVSRAQPSSPGDGLGEPARAVGAGLMGALCLPQFLLQLFSQQHLWELLKQWTSIDEPGVGAVPLLLYSSLVPELGVHGNTNRESALRGSQVDGGGRGQA